MSHPEQREFLSIVARNSRSLIDGKNVLEIGSYDVNGEMRQLFDKYCDIYIGCDLVAGPSVDVVGFGHELTYKDGHFSLIFSAECFEHDVYWKETFLNMIRMTNEGGIVAFTCGGPGRPEHGTVRTDPSISPGTQSIGLDYYKNLSKEDFQAVFDFDAYFSSYEFYRFYKTFDLYFVGVRKGKGSSEFLFPTHRELQAIKRMTSFGFRLTRFPLRFFRHFLSENKYQNLAILYLKFIDRA